MSKTLNVSPKNACLKFCSILFFLSFLVLFLGPVNAFAFDHHHAKWTSILKQHTNEGGFVYYKKLKDAVKSQDHPFNLYLAELTAVSKSEFDKFTSEQQQAFLINAYNAFTIKLIIDHYPVTSIKKIGGWFTKPWDVKFFKLLGGEIQSLDPIEHEWLRPKYKDYRIHAALNCASVSCPALLREAYTAEKLNQQLDEQMRAWLSDPTRNQYNLKEGTLNISKIFSWYEEDFEKWGGGVLNVIKKYGPKEAQTIAEKSKDISYMNYNWDLNAAKRD